MKEKLIKIMELGNGQVLKLYDASQKLKENKWQVFLIARVEISISSALFNGNMPSSVNIHEIVKALGNTIVFEQKKICYADSGAEKNEAFKNLCISFLAGSLSILSDSGFPGKFVLKRYKEFLEQSSDT